MGLELVRQRHTLVPDPGQYDPNHQSVELGMGVLLFTVCAHFICIQPDLYCHLVLGYDPSKADTQPGLLWETSQIQVLRTT